MKFYFTVEVKTWICGRTFFVGVVNCHILCEGWPTCPKPRSHMACPFFQTSCSNPSCKNCCPTYSTPCASQPWITNTILMLFIAPFLGCMIGLEPNIYISSNDTINVMNKGWFKVVGKSVAWNALKIVWIDHRYYLNIIKENGFEMQSF